MTAPGTLASPLNNGTLAEDLLAALCSKTAEQGAFCLVAILGVESRNSLWIMASAGTGAASFPIHAGQRLFRADSCPHIASCLRGERITVPDILGNNDYSDWHAAARAMGCNALDFLPVRDGHKTKAILATFAPHSDHYSQPVRNYLNDLVATSNSVGLANLICRAMAERLEKYYRALSTLGELIASNPDRRKLIEETCEIFALTSQSTLAAVVIAPSDTKNTEIISRCYPVSTGTQPDDKALERLARDACRTDRTLLPHGAHDSAIFLPASGKSSFPNSRSGLAVPFAIDKKHSAVLVALSNNPLRYDQGSYELAKQMAASLGNALNQTVKQEEDARYQAFYSALANINALIARHPHPSQLYEETCRQIARISPELSAFFAIEEATPGRYRITACAGSYLDDSLVEKLLETPFSSRIDDPGGRGIIGQVARAGTTVLWTPTASELKTNEALKFAHKQRLSSLVGIPVFRADDCIGVLILGAREKRYFTPELIGLTERFAENVSQALLSRHQRDMLQHQALTDSLTGLPNRTLYADRLHIELARSRREKTKVALAIINLDRLKDVNDQLGHPAGDKIIVDIANRLLKSLREQDTLARYSGDEFVAVIPLKNSALHLGEILERLVHDIREPIQFNGQPIIVTASIGAAVFPDEADAPESLMRSAELATYRRKQCGGNGWHLFESTAEEPALERIALQKRFLHAVEAGEIIFLYQPVVDMHEGLVAGAEALARWQHPERGLIPPSQWIPFVESDTRLISALGRHALQIGIRQLAKWHAKGCKLTLSINIGALHFLSGRFIEDLKEALACVPTQIPRFLALEITESAVVTDFSRLNSVLMECRRLGVRIALDDFGTGHGSLVYLQKLPSDILKLDLEFVLDLPWNIRAFSIIAGTLQISRLSRVRVVAEGVETEEHGIRLLQMGCQYAQGFAISHPLAIEEFDKWSLDWLQPESWRALVPKPPLPHSMQLLAGLVYHRSRHRLLLSALEDDHGHTHDVLLESASAQCPLKAWSMPGASPLLDPAHERIHERIHRLEGHSLNLLLSGKNPGPWLAEFLRRRSVALEAIMEQRIRESLNHSSNDHLSGIGPEDLKQASA